MTRAIRAACALLALAHLVLFGYLVARRLTYPFDLEWMEGGMLLHARRILDGRPLYGPPSVDFVPYLYTPLYPVVLALLGRVVGIGYVLGRVVSLGSLAAALALGYRAARRAGADWVSAAAAMACVLAAFRFTGAWYDLVRNDELFLALGMGGVACALAGRAPLAAGLLVASYFSKQTGSALLVLGLIACAARGWRHALRYAAVAGGLWGALVWAGQARTHGWF
jgi:hypothetical protein